MSKSKTIKRDEIADFCKLLMRIDAQEDGHLRIGQIIGNALRKAKTNTDPFYVENEVLIEGMEDLYVKNKAKEE